MFFILLPGMILFGMAAIFYSEPVLTLADDGGKVDVIVVPGGDGPPRAEQAARLWKQGRSPVILITGDGDCLFNKRIMVRDGVSPSAIIVECKSGSTWQNAFYSAPVMRRIHARKALIVTNWYHSRRAVASFRTVCPQMQFSSSPINSEVTHAGFSRSSSDLELIALEYVKLGWYLLSGRISLGYLASSQTVGASDICAIQGSGG